MDDMAAEVVRQQCQRIGCDAEYTEEENFENSCTFHVSQPVFHDGGKEWSCCKQKSHDFTMFLALPGCQTGKHTSEKPKPAAPPVPKKGPTPIAAAASAATCSRCKQGFFCSDHGSKVPTKVLTPASAATEMKPPAPTAVPKVVDLNAKQTCKHKGCGKQFTEKENTATSCKYHPGPVVFHDRQKGWECCDVHVNDFDEFLEIPPCTTGWHNANPEKVQTRLE
ncbi:unnamed protein product [Calypogeia fissa]